jgi:hypothetical protein
MRHLQDRELIAKIEGSRRRLIDRLTKEFPALSLVKLRDACETLESEVIGFLVDTAFENATELFGMRKGADGIHLLDDRGSYYQITAARSVREPSQNIVFLRPTSLDTTAQVPREFLISIEGFGSCRSISFLYLQQDAYRLNFELIRGWFKGIFEAAYHWFFEVAGSVTNFQLAELANNLYSYSRRYIPKNTLGANLWFSVIVNGYGFRLAEPDVARNAFRIIDTNNRSQAHSTNRYVSELLGTFLDESLMLMRRAIDDGLCVDVDMGGTEYRKEGSIYALTLTALYGHESFSIYPVFKGNPLSVGAVFPTEVRRNIEPILDEIIGDLEAMCSSYREPSGEALKIFTSSAYMLT